MGSGYTMGYAVRQEELKIKGLFLSHEVQFNKLVQV